MHGGEIEGELLIAWIELEGDFELRFRQRGLFFRDRQDTCKLMIFQIRAAGDVHGIKRFASKIELAESKRRGGERDFVRGVAWFECDHLFAPGKSLAPTGYFRRFRHDSAGGDIFWIELQEVARDQHGALVILVNKKFLRLLGEMVPPPNAVNPITAEAESGEEDAGDSAARPPLVEIPSLQRPDVTETIVTS